MHYLYILYSPSLNKYYTGQSFDGNERLHYHNSEKNSIWTKRGQPWMIAGLFAFKSKKEAIIAERFIKKQKSKKTIEKILEGGFRLGKLFYTI